MRETNRLRDAAPASWLRPNSRLTHLSGWGVRSEGPERRAYTQPCAVGTALYASLYAALRSITPACLGGNAGELLLGGVARAKP